MANTYNWKINALDAHISHEGQDNVVYTIHWSYVASDDSDPVISKSMIGTHSVEYDADNFTPYADLVESDVIGWLESAMDVEAMKTNLDAQIELEKTPVQTTFHNPFPASE